MYILMYTFPLSFAFYFLNQSLTYRVALRSCGVFGLICFWTTDGMQMPPGFKQLRKCCRGRSKRYLIIWNTNSVLPQPFFRHAGFCFYILPLSLIPFLLVVIFLLIEVFRSFLSTGGVMVQGEAENILLQK